MSPKTIFEPLLPKTLRNSLLTSSLPIVRIITPYLSILFKNLILFLLGITYKFRINNQRYCGTKRRWIKKQVKYALLSSLTSTISSGLGLFDQTWKEVSFLGGLTLVSTIGFSYFRKSAEKETHKKTKTPKPKKEHKKVTATAPVTQPPSIGTYIFFHMKRNILIFFPFCN